MKRSIIYVINPIAGTRTKKDLQSFIEKKTAERKIPFQIFPSVANGDYSFLEDIIREHEITDVVIAAGDGTVSQVVGSLQKTNVNFGIIPCGSGNGLALAAGISKDPGKALEVIFTGKPEITDAFTINDHFACMLCGIGFDAKVAHDFAKQPKRGLATYIRQTLKNFMKARTYSFEVKVGNKVLDIHAYFISIANSNQFGNNFTIAPKASLNDGLLDIVIMASKNRLQVIWQTLQQVGGYNPLLHTSKIDTKKGAIYFQTDRLHIINHSEAPLHIDGDPAETPEKMKIEIRKNYFKLLRPRSKSAK